MRQFRNFSIRLAITYITLSVLLLLPGIEIIENLFAIWAAALAFTLLSIFIRPVLLALTLPFIILSGGLFIFVVDGIILALTGLVSGLRVANIGWALLGVIVLGIVNIWVQGIFRRIGWIDEEGFVEDDNDENVVTQRNVKLWLRLLLIAMLLMGILFSYDMSRQIFIAGLFFRPDIQLMTGVAAFFWFLIALSIAWLVAEGLALNRRAVFSFGTVILAAVPLGLLARFVVFTPLPTASAQPADTNDVLFWETPDELQIGYQHLPAEGDSTTGNPIVFLHGGPGYAVSTHDVDFFSRLAGAGYDVYLYDRAGSGHSDLRPTLRDYSLVNDVTDLEFIRKSVGADQLILVSHAEGSDLAMAYLERHPDRVERIALIGPTPLFYVDPFIYDYGRTAGFGEFSTLDLRIEMAEEVALYSPDAAEEFAPQEEVNNWYSTYFDARIMVCPGDSIDIDANSFGRLNLYSDVRVPRSLSSAEAANIEIELTENTTPVILLRPICDFVPWETVLYFQDFLPNTRLYIIDDAGSMAYVSEPDAVEDVLLAFLSDQEPSLQPYTARTDPWTLLENIPIRESE